MATTLSPEYRIEELARKAQLSVDTIRYYQKRRLLDPPRRVGRLGWYSAEHVARLSRIRELREHGYSLALIRRQLDGGVDPADLPLAVAVADAADEHHESFTLAELAERSGVPVPLLEAVGREGLLIPRDVNGEERYGPSDVEVVKAGLALLDAGIPLDDLLALSRRHHQTTREIASAAVELFDQHVREPLRDSELNASARADRLVEAFAVMLPAVATMVANHFRRILLETAREHLESTGEEES